MAVGTAESDGESSDGDGEDIGVSYHAGRRGPNREDMVSSYLPAAEDWPAKTVLELNDPGRIAALAQFDRLFPEVEDLQPVINEFLDQFLRAKTSVAGMSRSEYQSIFESMYGGRPNDDKKVGQMLAEAFAADLGDDD